jgi:hypothetical protein
MSNSDLADQLSIKSLPIPTEQRLDVFVSTGVPQEAHKRWVSQAGKSEFWTLPCCLDAKRNPADFCGICLFGLEEGKHTLTSGQVKDLAPFYDRAGSEANVFQWNFIEKNFVRRDKHWFDERKT